MNRNFTPFLYRIAGFATLALAATRGLGLAMVEKFIELGHTVLGCGRSREAIESLRHKYQGAHDFALVDMARESQV